MNRPLLQGEFVRLTAVDPETDADEFARWSGGALFDRLLDTHPALPKSVAEVKEELQKTHISSNDYNFSIRTLADNRLVGFIDLDGIQWQHGSAFVDIGIGDPADWNQGYGTDALSEALRFAFEELNLHRVGLDVFEYNQRAIRCYEKVGFVIEGRMRGRVNRDGRRWDMIYMGILSDEWARISSEIEAGRQADTSETDHPL
jgi:RimJ/RimL family protein N-acetyltransferase